MAVTNKSTNRCSKVINGINGKNSIDNTKLSCSTLPPRQHHSFFRNLPLRTEFPVFWEFSKIPNYANDPCKLNSQFSGNSWEFLGILKNSQLCKLTLI